MQFLMNHNDENWHESWLTRAPSIALTYDILLHNLFCYPHKTIYIQHHTPGIIIRTIMVHYMSHQTDVSVEMDSLNSIYKSTSKTLRICNSTLNAHI